MNKWSSRLQTAATTLVLLIAVETLQAQAAEQQEVIYTKNTRQALSESKADPGYPGTGELAQQIFRDTDVESPDDFPLTETRIYNQDNTVAGDGTHRGYEVLMFKNGDVAYSRYEGTHKITVKEDGTWEVNYKGTQSFIGGTGMYKNIN